jgi:acid phosphatase family membrane protein YuiD
MVEVGGIHKLHIAPGINSAIVGPIQTGSAPITNRFFRLHRPGKGRPLLVHPGILALISGLAAQAAKVIIDAVLNRRFRPSIFFDNGGMPSSHTATVTALALAVGRTEGFGSSMFSLVLIFSLFVIFEATGLRQEIGKQAEVINDLMDSALAGKKVPGDRLRELMGHTWGEVAGGVVVGVGMYLWLGQSAAG